MLPDNELLQLINFEVLSHIFFISSTTKKIPSARPTKPPSPIAATVFKLVTVTSGRDTSDCYNSGRDNSSCGASDSCTSGCGTSDSDTSGCGSFVC